MGKIIILFLTMLLLISSSYACKVDLHNAMLVEKDPYLAKTAVTGKILIEKDGDTVLKVDKYWGNHLPSYLLDYLLSYCSVQVDPSFEYLFLSVREIRDGEMISRGGGVFIRLSNSKEYMKKLSTLTNFTGEANPAWQFCQSDDECVEVKNKCDKPIAINKNYEKNYLDFLKTSDRKWDCSNKRKSKTVGKCMNNFCS